LATWCCGFRGGVQRDSAGGGTAPDFVLGIDNTDGLTMNSRGINSPNWWSV
jgi:hypothetical protein